MTYANNDFVLFDDIYNRAITAQANVENETQLIRKLRQWKFEVVSKPYEVAYNIMPREASALAEEKLGPVVAELEAMMFSYPSFATVEWLTTGSSSRAIRLLMAAAWMLLEAVLVLAVTVAPLVVSFFVTMPLELEHSRCSTSTSTIQPADIDSVVSHLGAPRPKSIPGALIYFAFVAFILIELVEPLLVWLTYRAVGNTRMKWYHH